MGDIINNMEIFKKLNFDTSNQWIFYDERFHKFFDFFANNITDSNILEETEVLEREEYVKRHEYLEGSERRVRIEELLKVYPGLMKDCEEDVEDLTQDLEILEQSCLEYGNLIKDMQETKNDLNCKLNYQEKRCTSLTNAEAELALLCRKKAKRLEELQEDNHKKCQEVVKTFTTMHSPPLFMHQLSLDQYFLKCDSFTQYLSLYLKDNFKIQDYNDLDTSLTENQETAEKLEKLKKSMRDYKLAYIKEKAKCRATQTVIESLNLSQIHVISLSDMERETHELSIVNSHQNIANQTLMVDLNIQIQLQAQKTIEQILYENTKQKLERALKRHENVKSLMKIISDAISNAELIWINIQMDLEKNRNRFDNTEQLTAATQQCLQRIQLMNQATNQHVINSASLEFINQLSQQLGKHLRQQLRCDVKGCLYEYEKFKRLVNYALQGLLNRKPYNAALEKMKEIKRLEATLVPFVYDSPVNVPMFENVHYLRPIFNVQNQQQRIEKQLRHLRTQFQENISKRFEKDKLWRYSQLLWIWFLTEPRRVLHAIEEAKKAASKVPQLTGIKALGGIKRK
ncbi:augmin complex subunit dgt3 [Lucilia cuprina]|uniref:augmin complex subunit dgt3 n=1 Tax=Lucilia cuprina TaxID=7375 RepID=UPI001F05C1D2|nr:augmin complex subunit dgt3 [Lucilia cuprina]